MNTTAQISNRNLFFEATLGRSAAAASGGIAAIVLAIIGLVGAYPIDMLAEATLVLGVTFLFKGAAAFTDFTQALTHNRADTLQEAEIRGGITAEILTGAAGVALGILALLRIAPLTLGACALLAFGGGAFLSCGVTHCLNHVRTANMRANDSVERVATDATVLANGSQMLTAMAVAVLGILSLVGMAPVTLTLVGMLGVGAVTALTGSTMGAKVMHMLRA